VLPALFQALLPALLLGLLAIMTSDATQRALHQPSHPSEMLAHQ
jgi:hypothetical protein